MRALLRLPLLSFVLQAQAAPDLQPLLDGLRARTGVPGLAAAVVRDGRIVASAVSGVRELGQASSVATKDRWVVGSCTKAMTRLLLCRLAQSGKLRFEMTLSEAFPGMKLHPGYAKATVGDLLRHTAGLPPYTRIGPKMTPFIFTLKGTPKEKREAFAAHVLMEAPTEVGRFAYSNAGFALLGALAERVGGAPWEELMAREVFGPLHMSTAVIGLPTAHAAGPMPTGHAHEGGAFQVEKEGPPLEGLFAPAGGVVLTIDDFARFAMAQAAVEAGTGHGYLDAKTAASLPRLLPADADRGEGAVFLGGQGTYTAGFAVWPSKQFGVVVATNGGDSDEVCEVVVEALRAAYAPEIASKPKPPQGPRLGIQLRAEAGGDLFIGEVMAGGLGQRAGLQAGDRIVAIDGRPVKEMDQAAVMAGLRRPGAKLSLMRSGKAVEARLSD